MSQNLNLQEMSSASTLSALVAGLPATYASEEVSLWSNNNTWSSVNSWVSKTSPLYPTFNWNAGTAWDVKAAAAWGVGDETEPETYETKALVFNPFVSLYGYLSAYFDFHFPYGMIGVNAYLSPTSGHVFDFSVTTPVNGYEGQTCWGATAFQNPLDFEIGFAFGWPSCNISLFDSLFGEGISAQGCTTEYFGSGYGNVVPFFSWESALFLK